MRSCSCFLNVTFSSGESHWLRRFFARSRPTPGSLVTRLVRSRGSGHITSARFAAASDEDRVLETQPKVRTPHNVIKRTFDVVSASAGLLCLWPLFVIVAILIKLDSDGPIFFIQERIGKAFQPFWIYKFRTMCVAASSSGRQSPAGMIHG